MIRRQVFDDGTCQLATRIPRTLHRAVKIAALNDGMPIAQWVSDALERYLGRVGGDAITDGDESTPKRPLGDARRKARASA